MLRLVILVLFGPVTNNEQQPCLGKYIDSDSQCLFSTSTRLRVWGKTVRLFVWLFVCWCGRQLTVLLLSLSLNLSNKQNRTSPGPWEASLNGKQVGNDSLPRVPTPFKNNQLIQSEPVFESFSRMWRFASPYISRIVAYTVLDTYPKLHKYPDSVRRTRYFPEKKHLVLNNIGY